MRFKALVLACAVGLGAAAMAADQPKGELIGPPRNDFPEAVKPKVNQAAIDKLGFSFGVQAYTFREVSTFETLDRLQFLGIHNVEFYPGQKLSKEAGNAKCDHNMSDAEVQSLLAKCKACGVTPVSYGVVGLSKNEAESRKVFDWAKKMGIKTIVSEPQPNKETFDVIEKLCNEYDINVAMHDHPKPSTYWDPKTVLMVVEGRTKKLGSCSDTGHWVRSGLKPVDCIKMLEGRVIELHLKDVAPKGNGFEDVPWGTGVADAKGIMAELQRQGAHPCFNVEYESSHGTALINNVSKCYEEFSKMAEELTQGK
jgi:sugar phosphate isomerase/epimerase